MTAPAHLRVYRFDPGAVFDGGLLGAIERLQLGGDTRVLDALFVRRDAASGAVDAVDLATGGAGDTFASLLDFRLDPGRRSAITERTLADHPHGVPRALIDAVADTLPEGAAVLAVLDTGGAATALEAAVSRCDGRALGEALVDARELAQADPQLRAVTGAPAAGA